MLVNAFRGFGLNVKTTCELVQQLVPGPDLPTVVDSTESSAVANSTVDLRFYRGDKRYEISNHLGNVLVVVSDRKLWVSSTEEEEETVFDHYLADLYSVQDYDPFGMGIPERSWSAPEEEGYRFGFNGQEKSREINGTESSFTAEFWEYDARTVRRWNIDPVDKPWQGAYVCLSDNPVWRVDPNGNDDFFNSDGTFSHRTKTGTQIRILSTDGKSSMLFSDLNVKDKSNWQPAAKIVAHYAAQIGYKGKAGISPNTSLKALAYTNDKGIWVVAKNGINASLSDYANLKSTLAHENEHWKESADIRRVYKFADHVEVYKNQMSHESFKETTKEYKHNIGRSFAGHLVAAFNNQQISSEKFVEYIEFYNNLNTGMQLSAEVWGGGASIQATVIENGKVTNSETVKERTDPHQ